MPPIKGHKASIQFAFEAHEKVFVEYYGAWYEAKVLKQDEEDGVQYYHVHYVGWNKTRDEWVAAERVLKHTEENLQMALESQAQVQEASKQVKKRGPACSGGRKTTGSGEIDGGGTVWKQKPETTAMPHQDSSINIVAEQEKRQERSDEQTAVQTQKEGSNDVLNMPEKLKRILYEDFLSKNHSVTSLRFPAHKWSVNDVLQDYIEYVTNRKGNVDDAIDTCNGLKEFFNETIQDQLLITSERCLLSKYLEKLEEKKEPVPEMTAIFDPRYLLRMYSRLGAQIEKEFCGSDLQHLVKQLDRFLKYLTTEADKYFGAKG